MLLVKTINNKEYVDKLIIEIVNKHYDTPDVLKDTLMKQDLKQCEIYLKNNTQDRFTIIYNFLQDINNIIINNNPDSHKEINQPVNLYYKITLDIINKNIEIIENIKLLLNDNHIYGAYSLWRNLFEMTVVMSTLLYPLEEGNFFDKTNTLFQRYYDYSFIENAKMHEIALFVPEGRYIVMDDEDQKIYDEERKIYNKYNIDDKYENLKNKNKMIKSYDWSIPIFRDNELNHMLSPMQPSFKDLVDKNNEKSLELPILYKYYMKASGYIHSSYLSTQNLSLNTKNESELYDLLYKTIKEFINVILNIPASLIDSLYKEQKIERQKSLNIYRDISKTKADVYMKYFNELQK